MLRHSKMQQMYSRAALAVLLALIRKSRVQVESRQALLLLEERAQPLEQVWPLEVLYSVELALRLVHRRIDLPLEHGE
jgi:hypothetical protein